MKGDDFINEVSKHLLKGEGPASDSAIAKWLGVTQPQLGNYRKKDDLSPRQVLTLLQKFHAARVRDEQKKSIVTIVEFLPIYSQKNGRSHELFSTWDTDEKENRYWAGIKNRLQASSGIYVFYDSRGRAIYAGKAVKQPLWKEMNLAFNRDRGDVQHIKRVKHPHNDVAYRGPSEKNRSIQKDLVVLEQVAKYFSAYEVPSTLVSKMEALIIRAFANDLLNVRMENF